MFISEFVTWEPPWIGSTTYCGFNLAFETTKWRPFPFNSMTLILDAATDDVSATVGFESDDCDRDFETVVARDAIAVEPPTSKP